MRNRNSVYCSPLRVSDLDAMFRPQTNTAPAPVPLDPMTLSTLQQAALLMLHESVAKRTVIRELLQDSQDIPRAPQFMALAERGLCKYNPGKRQNDLTPAGLIAVHDLEKKLCAKLGIHIMSGFSRVTTTGGDTFRSCSCGQWRWSGRAGRYTDSNARRAHGIHIATAQGTTKLYDALKPPVAVEG